VGIARHYKDTFYGGAGGMMGGTVASLVKSVMHSTHHSPLVAALVESVVIAVLLLTVFVLVSSHISGEKKKRSFHLQWIFAYLSAFVVITYTFNILFKAGFPSGRAAIYLIPLFILLSMALWSRLALSAPPARKMVNVCFALLAVVALVHHVSSMNITYHDTWKYDSSTKEAMQDLVELHSGGCGQENCTTLGVNWVFEPSVNFYRERYGLDWVEEAHRDGYDDSYDYYYITWDEKSRLDGYGLEIVESYGLSQTYLARHP
jgi:hypothetical protein